MSRFGEQRLLDLLDRALPRSEADETELAALSNDRDTARFAGSVLHQNGAEESVAVTARSVVDGRIGMATTNDLSDAGLDRVMQTAFELARSSPAVEGFQGLPGPSPLPETVDADPETTHPDPAAKCRLLGEQFEVARKNGCELHGSFTTQFAVRAVANSHGVRDVETTTQAECVFIAVADEASGYSSEMNRAVGGLPISERADEAIEKARRGQGERRELDPGAWDVLLEPAAVSEILEWFAFIGFSSQAFESGSSFLRDREGTEITGEHFTLIDDPGDPAGLPSRFDAEGTPRQRTVLIENGRAITAVFDKITADRLGREPTGHAVGGGSDVSAMPSNLFIAPGEESHEELLSRIERGVLVTRFHYLNGFLDPRRATMTGMTRDGTFLVEDGQVVAPVVDMRWTEPILEAFRRIDGISRETRTVGAWYGSAANNVPALLIRGFQFTGRSS